MSHNARGGLYLTKRDLALFRYLFLMKIATAEQINEDVFRLLNRDSVTERLRQLVKKRYLQRVPVESGTLKYGYGLTQASFQPHLANSIQRPWKQLKSEAPSHDVALVDIRRRFLRCKSVLTYLTENALESETGCPLNFPTETFVGLHSDGAIIFKNNGDHFFIAIEYENSQQKTARYEQHFTQYYLKKEVHGVIYIARDKALKERLMELDRGKLEIKHSKFFFAELSEVLGSETILHFTNVQGDELQME